MSGEQWRLPPECRVHTDRAQSGESAGSPSEALKEPTFKELQEKINIFREVLEGFHKRLFSGNEERGRVGVRI